MREGRERGSSRMKDAIICIYNKKYFTYIGRSFHSHEIMNPMTVCW